MKCFHPILVKYEKYQFYVPCGKCSWCRSRLRDEWFVRLTEESKNHAITDFVTLTYDDEHLQYNVNEETGELVPTVSKDDAKRFIKAIRNKDKKIRYFLCSEYGSKDSRPHYHAIIFCDDNINYADFWQNGFANAQRAKSGACLKYCTKYILKGSNVPENADKNFRLMSRKPGIGASGVEQLNLFDSGEDLTSYCDGKIYPAPRYYRKLIEKQNPEFYKQLSHERIEYLADKSKYADLEKVYNHKRIGQPFEQWLSDKERIEDIKQFKINKK